MAGVNIRAIRITTHPGSANRGRGDVWVRGGGEKGTGASPVQFLLNSFLLGQLLLLLLGNATIGVARFAFLDFLLNFLLAKHCFREQR